MKIKNNIENKISDIDNDNDIDINNNININNDFNNTNKTNNNNNKNVKIKNLFEKENLISPIYGINVAKTQLFIPNSNNREKEKEKEIPEENDTFELSMNLNTNPNSESGKGTETGSDSKDVFLSCLIKHCLKCEEKKAYSCLECDNGYDLHEKKCYSNFFYFIKI